MTPPAANSTPAPPTLCTTRRTVLASALGVPATAFLLASCGSKTATENTPATADNDSTTTAAGAAAGQDAAAATDVPVGKAIIATVAGKQVAISQPSAGTFKAFEAICTHQGAKLTVGKADKLVCPLHSSTFDSATGQRQSGPATKGLKELTVTESAGRLLVTL